MIRTIVTLLLGIPLVGEVALPLLGIVLCLGIFSMSHDLNAMYLDDVRAANGAEKSRHNGNRRLEASAELETPDSYFMDHSVTLGS
jgi:hypothetical protein